MKLDCWKISNTKILSHQITPKNINILLQNLLHISTIYWIIIIEIKSLSKFILELCFCGCTLIKNEVKLFHTNFNIMISNNIFYRSDWICLYQKFLFLFTKLLLNIKWYYFENYYFTSEIEFYFEFLSFVWSCQILQIGIIDRSRISYRTLIASLFNLRFAQTSGPKNRGFLSIYRMHGVRTSNFN